MNAFSQVPSKTKRQQIWLLALAFAIYISFYVAGVITASNETPTKNVNIIKARNDIAITTALVVETDCYQYDGSLYYKFSYFRFSDFQNSITQYWKYKDGTLSKLQDFDAFDFWKIERSGAEKVVVSRGFFYVVSNTIGMSSIFSAFLFSSVLLVFGESYLLRKWKIETTKKGDDQQAALEKLKKTYAIMLASVSVFAVLMLLIVICVSFL